jgi:hypothetical protein
VKVPDQSVPPGETQIKVILRRMTEVGRRETEARQAEYREALAPVNEIRRALRKTGQKLPLPAFAAGELETIQTAAIERGDYRLAGYLERVRLELADARSTDEIGRLKGRLLISELRARAFVNQRAELHLSSAQYEQGESGRRDAPAGLAAIFATVTAKLTGRRKSARQVQLDELKTEISHRLKERDNGLFNAIAAENKRIGFLSRMLRDDPAAGKEGIAEILTGAELSESEAIGRRLLLPEVVRQSWELQKTVLARDETKGRDNLLAGRAVARKILADADLAETKDKCQAFLNRRHFARVPVATADSAAALSLHDIGIKPHAPVLDQALDFFIAGSERYLIRQQIESALSARHDELTARIAQAGQIARDADRDAAPFIRKNLLRNPELLAAPVFTRQEIIRLEQRAARTDNAREARFLREILGNPETRVIRNLEAILENGRAPAQQPASRQPHHDAETNLTTGEKMQRRGGE